jgi:spermidine/putrescine ABC transporter ATP-binding subunit
MAASLSPAPPMRAPDQTSLDLEKITRRHEVFELPILDLRRLTKRFGDFVAVDDLSLEIASGEFLTLLGASGSGKTTTLRMIAGFERPSGGEILMAGQPIAALPPFKRDINTVFQHYALFPHMSVRDNVGYGLRMRGVSRAEREDRVTRALEMVKLTELGARAPRQLSGGQQQRVALARALVNRPRVLLLDEPLGALDLKLRKEMQLELKHLQTHLGITFVYVTHDQEEALTMSDRIVLMRQGRIAQVGTPRDLYDRPASRYVADFIGDTNLLPGVVAESGNGLATLRMGDATLRGVSDGALTAGQEAWLTVRPEAIRLSAGATPAGHNAVTGTVSDAVYAGSSLRVHVSLPGGRRLVASVPSGTSVTRGAAASLTWPVEQGRCVGD